MITQLVYLNGTQMVKVIGFEQSRPRFEDELLQGISIDLFEYFSGRLCEEFCGCDNWNFVLCHEILSSC
jgi:hypothetical protein